MTGPAGESGARPAAVWSCHCGLVASVRAAKPLETVEDEVESEQELVGEVVSGPRDVLDDRLGNVGILVGSELEAHALRRRCELPGGADRQGLLLQRKAVDVGV